MAKTVSVARTGLQIGGIDSPPYYLNCALIPGGDTVPMARVVWFNAECFQGVYLRTFLASLRGERTAVERTKRKRQVNRMCGEIRQDNLGGSRQPSQRRLTSVWVTHLVRKGGR